MTSTELRTSQDREIVIWGASGHCRVVIDVLKSQNRRIAVTCDRHDVISPVSNVPLIVGREAFLKWLVDRDPESLGFVVAIGGDRGADRLEIADWLDGLD